MSKVEHFATHTEESAACCACDTFRFRVNNAKRTLIDSLEQLPDKCTCAPQYKNRRLVDPKCLYCAIATAHELVRVALSELKKAEAST